jgi:hypothetical protein
MRASQWIAILVCATVSLSIASQAYAGCPRDDLRLNEICFLPAAGEHQWVEVTNVGDDPVNSGGVEILSNGGAYSLPAELSAIPKDGIVVVHFDGAGAAGNDYSFAGDNKAELHTEAGTVDVLGSPAGYCSLYRVTGAHSKETLLDFVAWGSEPGDAAKDAVAKRLWSSTKVHLWTDPDNPPMGPGGWAVVAGDTIGRNDVGAWEHFSATKGTKGEEAIAVPSPIFPNDGMAILQSPARCTFAGAQGAIEYQVQIASDEAFANVVRELTTRSPKQGTRIQPPLPLHAVYWWRVRGVGQEGQTSDWSQAVRFTVGRPAPPAQRDTKERSSTKSGYMVSGRVVDSAATAGSDDSLPGATVTIAGKSDTTDEFGDFVIGGIDPGTYAVAVTRSHYSFPSLPSVTVVDGDVGGVTVSGQGENASIAVTALAARKDTKMLAYTPGPIVRDAAGNRHQYMPNRHAAQDKAWDQPSTRNFVFDNELENWWCWAVGATMINNFYGGSLTRDEVVYHIKGNLLFDDHAGANVFQCLNSLYYAMSLPELSVIAVGIDATPGSLTKPSENLLKGWLDDGRPVYSSQPGHVMVLSGYIYLNGDFYVKHLNTDNNGSDEDRLWSAVNLGGNLITGYICWCPQKGLTARAGDTRVNSDEDSDGVCDFDEDVRFQPGGVYPHDFLLWGGVGLDRKNEDSDGDGISDKDEIASWVFPRGAENGGDVGAATFVDPDVDNDKRFPAVDPDSDNGGIEDGDEDTTPDGVLTSGEGDVFDLDDDGSLDLIFCIDTTGSMGDDIDAVKAQAVDIVNQIAEDFPNFRVAVVDYRDHPVDPYGEPGIDYPYNDVLAFSTDKAAVISAINSLSLGSGNDWEESVYSAIMHCINASTLGGWREDPVTRKIIVMGDAPPHDPEPFTGYTLDSVEAAASVGGTVWEYGYTKGDGTKGDDDELSGPISGISIVTSGSLPSFEDIAEVMDGLYLEAGGAGDLPDAVREALDAIKTDPIVTLEVQGDLGDTNILADASKTVDPKCCGILMYEWDWEADGTYDEWSYSPVVTHEYAGGFGGRVRVRATSVTGEEGTDTFIILIPEFLDVTEYTDTEALASHLNRDTGAIVCDLEIGNKTDTIKTLKDKFYFCLPPTADLFLANADGTLEDGTPYVDVTDLVESVLPTVGDGDLELDPGETVRLDDAIEIYSRDRSMPTGFVFAVWADPPPSIAPVHYPTKLGHPKDVNDDFVIDDFEILEAVDHWSGGQVDDFGLLEAIELWRAGGYEWDEAQGKFAPSN